MIPIAISDLGCEFLRLDTPEKPPLFCKNRRKYTVGDKITNKKRKNDVLDNA